MNIDHLRKSVNHRVRIRPIAKRFDGPHELPKEDDIWVIERVSPEGVYVHNTRTGHVTTLGLDHVLEYSSDPDRSVDGQKHGFLILKIQVYLREGNRLTIEPIGRPGAAI